MLKLLIKLILEHETILQQHAEWFSSKVLMRSN